MGGRGSCDVDEWKNWGGKRGGMGDKKRSERLAREREPVSEGLLWVWFDLREWVCAREGKCCWPLSHLREVAHYSISGRFPAAATTLGIFSLFLFLPFYNGSAASNYYYLH